MNSETIGILLFLLVLLLAFGSFGLNFVNKKITQNYFFWSIPAIIIFAYFVDIRYFEDWSDFFKDTSFITGTSLTGTSHEIYFNSIKISKALLLDLCPLLGILMPLSLIFDKTRKTSYVMAPFSILGGIVSFGSILGGISPGGSVEFTYEYIFVGHPGNELYFFLHSYLIIIGFMLVFQSNVNRWKYVWTYYLFITIYFLYINICVNSLGVIYNTSGVSIRDWLPAGNSITNQPYDGEYSGMSIIFNNMPYPSVMLLSYFLGWLTINSIILLQILLRDISISKIKNKSNELFMLIKIKYKHIKNKN